uniref:SEA domain-containing protein n=1 Tax=Sphenodon punctatus TaxID=8508 RepID=A0A8D0GY28_SPHPU
THVHLCLHSPKANLFLHRCVNNGDDTRVNTICTYRNNSTITPFDRVHVYREVSNQTNGITKLGIYNLDKTSLYVDEYHEPPAVPTGKPTTPAAPVSREADFTVNFTITNLRCRSGLAIRNTKTFNNTRNAVIYLLDRLLRNTRIGPAFTGCKMEPFSCVNNGDDTRVNTICTYRNNSTITPFARVHVYHEVSNQTNGITKLGIYNLDKTSLYVNGYNEKHTMPSVTPSSSQSPKPAIEHFTMNFTVTDLRYTPELSVPGSRRFNSSEKTLLH